MVRLFCAFNITRLMKNFILISLTLIFFNKKLYLNEILYISGNIDNTKKADQILEIPGLYEFFGYCFKYHRVVADYRNIMKTTFYLNFNCNNLFIELQMYKYLKIVYVQVNMHRLMCRFMFRRCRTVCMCRFMFRRCRTVCMCRFMYRLICTG